MPRITITTIAKNAAAARPVAAAKRRIFRKGIAAL